MFSVLKNVCICLIMLFILSGCFTVHNLNVTSGYTPPPQTPVAMNTMDTGGNSSTSTADYTAPPQAPVAMNPVDNGGNISTDTQKPDSINELGDAGPSTRRPPIAEMGTPTPPAPSLASLASSYIIHVGDRLDIKFFYHKGLNEEVMVRPDGRISLQLVHDVQAASLTTNELVALLKEKYSSYLNNPEISVIVRTFESNKVFVDGEVYRSGMVEMAGNMTIMQSIAGAGGLKDTARRSDVLLIRQNGLKKPFVYTINLAAAMSGTDISQNVVLKPQDIVYVPKSAIANVNVWVDQYIRKNIPINVGFDIYRLYE